MRPIEKLRAAVCKSGADRGIVLVTALLVMIVLLPLAVVFLNLASTESSIAENEFAAARGFGISEAGLEHARRQLLGTDIAALLQGGGNLFTNEAFGGGSYSVTVSNNINPPFPKGVIPADAGGATNDTDGFLVITSTGTYEGASRTTEVVVRVADFEAPGALYLPGTAPDVETNFSGDSFTISGYDTKLDGTPGTGVAMPGIATSDAALATEITDADLVNGGLSASQFDNVPGQGPDPSVQTTTASYDVQAAITTLLTYPHTTLTNGIINSDTWGTDAAPQITYIDAAAAQINGNVSGSGVLIVNGTLKVKSGSSFNFHGLVIVFDEISFQDNVNVEILGAFWLDRSPTLNPAKAVEFDVVGGNTALKYSSEALNMVSANWALPGGSGGNEAWPIVSWQELK